MSEDLIRESSLMDHLSNDQRHDAALTIAEYADNDVVIARQLLVVVGLARAGISGTVADGDDEWGLSWFTPAPAASGDLS